ncbi:MAG: hypothetical protein EBR09_16735, partial [Proteobacteria bacterium]|nr:hypothetical protein [Pseudomonadota bacterium]
MAEATRTVWPRQPRTPRMTAPRWEAGIEPRCTSSLIWHPIASATQVRVLMSVSLCICGALPCCACARCSTVGSQPRARHAGRGICRQATNTIYGARSMQRRRALAWAPALVLLGLAREARSQCPSNAQLPTGATQWPSCACNAGFTNTSGLVNLARACSAGGCTVTGISDYGNTFRYLVDGDTSVTAPLAHTASTAMDWMMIDLGQTGFVNHVQIFNRLDCCEQRINNFEVRVGYSSEFWNNPACVTGGAWFSDVKNFSCVLNGRYVSIRIMTSGGGLWLNLRELQVYGLKTSNLARACSAGNCPVTTSSVLTAEFPESFAVNGITNDKFISLLENNPYLMIDMQQTVFVAMVRIWNRADCCWERLDNFQIRVGDSGTSAGSSNAACASNQPWFQGQKDFTCVLSGRYLTIQQFTTNYLQIAEVEVYGLNASQWCTTCPMGTFKSSSGSGACTNCGASTYSGALGA